MRTTQKYKIKNLYKKIAHKASEPNGIPTIVLKIWAVELGHI